MGCVSCTGLVKEFLGARDQVILQLKESTTIPIEADSLTPDFLAERDHAAIKALPMFYGRRKVSLGDLFEVDGERSDRIVVQGDS